MLPMVINCCYFITINRSWQMNINNSPPDLEYYIQLRFQLRHSLVININLQTPLAILLT